MSHEIRTYLTRAMLDLSAPDACLDRIDIRDIAHGLSQINRFVGQTFRPYSVAEHSVLVSFQVSDHLALEALMHDAAEAYLGDVASPLKSLLPAYAMLEQAWMSAIFQRFGLGTWQCAEIKRADAMALEAEKDALVLRSSLNAASMPPEFGRMRNVVVSNGKMTPEEAGRQFLNRFYELIAERHLALVAAAAKVSA